jgi:hypothetical protein
VVRLSLANKSISRFIPHADIGKTRRLICRLRKRTPLQIGAIALSL